jgi:hypothetical protein
LLWQLKAGTVEQREVAAVGKLCNTHFP